MKIHTDCLYCLFARGRAQINRLTSDEERRFKALAGVMEIITAHVSSDASEKISHPLRLCPSLIGTRRDRYLQRFFNINDTYSQERARLKALTFDFWHFVEQKIKALKDEEEQLRLAFALATTANIIEYDMLNQQFESQLEQGLQNMLENAEKEWDNFSTELFPTFISEIAKAKRILFLADNIGESTLNAIVIDLLLHQKKHVTVAGKSSPILNDATVDDLEQLWQNLNTTMQPKIVSIGTNSVGLLMDEISDEFRSIIRQSDLIIAKGMGHFETLPEYRWNKSVWCLFRSKCEPVSKEAHTIVGKNCLRKIA